MSLAFLEMFNVYKVPDNLLEDGGRHLLHSLFPILGPLPGGVVRHFIVKRERLKIVKKRENLLLFLVEEGV